jgi:hypothetical protein
VTTVDSTIPSPFAGTLLSAQPIHKYVGACWLDRRVKNSGSWRVIFFAQARLFSNRLFSNGRS